MPEPKQQVEIQLGHMCNNRCVFCVSGQETELGRARPLAVEPILEQIRAARASGHAKITLLGGEPTLQPGFLSVVREAVALGFEEIVLFTNGAKTARASFIDEILATGGNFTWRISIQGATKESHERTTKKDGSFDRILRTMRTLHEKHERLTVNMCVVRSNYESVDRFPELLLPLEAKQLHLDMVRPLDAGARTEEELRDMIPRYSELVPALERMIAGFPADFDVNVGNLPYCIAPHLSRWIHHDGERTLTIAVDGEKLSRPWDKYLVKRRDKFKPETCGACVFESRCSGVFEAYAKFHGTDELVPVDQLRLRAVDPERHFLALHCRPVVASLAGWAPPPPWTGFAAREAGEREVLLELRGAEPLAVALRPAGTGQASFEAFSLHVASPGEGAASVLDSLWRALLARGERPLFPPAVDLLGSASRSIAARLSRLRDAAPFGALAWVALELTDGGKRAEATFEAPAGERAVVWLADDGGRPTGGYRVPEGTASPALIEGLRAVIGALGPASRARGARA